MACTTHLLSQIYSVNLCLVIVALNIKSILVIILFTYPRTLSDLENFEVALATNILMEILFMFASVAGTSATENTVLSPEVWHQPTAATMSSPTPLGAEVTLPFSAPQPHHQTQTILSSIQG